MKADCNSVATVRPAPSCNERRAPIDMLLLHYTGMSGGAVAEDWLCNAESGVSCHYIVHEDGRVVQMVPEALRAWHAGAGSWEGREDVNSRSVGIEIVNDGHADDAELPPFPEAQMQAVASLSRGIIERHGIAPLRVLGHSDTAPGRKIDPGEAFDWEWLAGQGVGVVAPAGTGGSGLFLQQGDTGAPVTALRTMLKMLGYGIEAGDTFDENMATIVTAFQRHWRRDKVDGVADRDFVERLHWLLRTRDSVAA
ncbi:N-acetylmuramoyl-L-alanine amidase [Rhizobiaceae bacterium]|nr:N-acetylmuramoyl-L-alanine amidase [Rhizobiaceae bacterium]